MSEYRPSADGHEHVLYRKRARHDFEAQYFESEEEMGSDLNKTEALQLHYDPVFERTDTIYCTCGETFLKPETAHAHAEEEGVLDEHQYDPERWEDE